ncbi:BlaI/MecI/CopY family transcriptional regulator [Paenibacillus chondroitinus]|uniref:BlaI/MecI/CopY family transcriptional regulator n=1 Tax=Paenibacillus chondroitinus TaxID=59842 RepID=A0ABU6DNV1_9BACL|nr:MULTISPECIES: BlaI/MecI/CopY family transcriptional regulator [Paenibacillus]MCY9661460.1 BlaI/MecI/CopY family transcriptional regulator [Paenibacillus anseongense]MEB4798678.1 BlaI/MecI/CopY family transcriptional regulator [Paenibacillus chondroitinus]
MKMQNFKYEGSGLNRFFGPLEAKIMEILWNSIEEMTIKDVQQKLDNDSKANNFNTVMTVMNRLVDKGILQKKALARSYQYSPVVTREAFMEAQSKELTLDLIEEFGSLAVTHMVDALDKVDPGLLDQLEQKIKEMKKDR